MRFFKIICFVFLILILQSCNKKVPVVHVFSQLNDSVKKEFAPDKRVAIYQIEIIPKQGKVLLKGETDKPKAIEYLKEKITAEGIGVTDSVVILPNTSVGDKRYAVVNNSVANIRSKPKHSGELATQSILGTGLKVLKIKGDFYLVQTPDAYISWVDHGGVELMNENEYRHWMESPKIIYTKAFGYVYQDEEETAKVSDIVLGSELILLEDLNDYYKVEYPDKRTGFVRKSESAKYDEWIKKVQPSGELIETYAREFLGAPYLWGGTSTKGMDCSGFTKTVYLMNGFVIPRDASQQIFAGEDVDPDLNFKNLQKGDLMFFGRKATDSTKQRVTHVGIWLGNGKGEFIHASRQVRLSSVDPDSPIYDKANTKRYLGSRRYLGIKDKMITNLKTDKPITDIKP